MGYVIGHCFPTGVHVTQFPGDFWLWLEMVISGCVCTTGAGAGCMNVKDISACCVGIAIVEASATASAFLTLASQFCWENVGSYPIFTFLSCDSFSMLCLVTMALLFTGVALDYFENGEGLGLEG